MTGKNKPLDDLSNLMTNAVGAIKGVGDEVKAMGRSQAEKFVQEMDLVSREEFDVLKARLDAALAEIETLKAAAKPAAKKTAAKKPAAKKPAAKKDLPAPETLLYTDRHFEEFFDNKDFDDLDDILPVMATYKVMAKVCLVMSGQ